MHALFFLGFTAFILCLILTPLCRNAFLRLGLVDQPDDKRKFHLRAVPRMGGIPIAIAYGGALLLLFAFNPGGGKLYIQHEQFFHALLPTAAIIFAVGLIDDLRGLRPRQKLLGQVLAAVLAVYLGIRLEIFPHHPFISVVLSIFWLVGCTNAVNLIDGMDGLATGVGLMATITTILVALFSGNRGLALATFPLAGALLGFLRYNFAPASVFLGDCGSLTIGFVLGCFGLIWSHHTGSLVGMLAPLMAFALPLIDVGLAICRRYLRSVPIFSPDRGHIHHKVLNLGFSTRGAALVLYAVCGLGASLAVLETVTHGGLRWPILGLFLVLVVVGINRLGYIEFSAARRTFSGESMRRAVQDEIYLRELELALDQADTLDDCWVVLRSVCTELKLASAHLECNGRSFEEKFFRNQDAPCCRIQLDLGDHGQLSVSRLQEMAPSRILMDSLHRVQGAVQARMMMPSLSSNTHAHAEVNTTAA